LARHIGTETLPGPPRRAAVTNIGQWAKAWPSDAACRMKPLGV